jgi:hypothetical protein
MTRCAATHGLVDASLYCVAPDCARRAQYARLFCGRHAAAPATRRGGWTSAYVKKLRKTQAAA